MVEILAIEMSTPPCRVCLLRCEFCLRTETLLFSFSGVKSELSKKLDPFGVWRFWNGSWWKGGTIGDKIDCWPNWFMKTWVPWGALWRSLGGFGGPRATLEEVTTGSLGTGEGGIHPGLFKICSASSATRLGRLLVRLMGSWSEFWSEFTLSSFLDSCLKIAIFSPAQNRSKDNFPSGLTTFRRFSKTFAGKLGAFWSVGFHRFAMSEKQKSSTYLRLQLKCFDYHWKKSIPILPHPKCQRVFSLIQ